MNLQEFNAYSDKRGSLLPLESESDIPFKIERVFFIYGCSPHLSRGQHAHFQTKQFIFCLSGRCEIHLDNGFSKNIFVLDAPNVGLFQDRMIWGEMRNLSKDCVLAVFASERYDLGDYILTYNEFKSLAKS